MLKTVRSRILFFSFFSILALSALALLSWSIIGKAENAAEDLIQNRMAESWLLDDLEHDLRRVQDLSFKIKGQLLLWDEINEEFASLAESIPAKWGAIQKNAQLSTWANDNEDAREAVVGYLEELAEGVEEKSYYQAGKTVDFSLFPALSPLLESINARKEGSRSRINQESEELLAYLDRQQVSLIIGSVAFLIVVVMMTFWLRQTVIVRLQRIERDIQRMDERSDLANPPGLAGSDEVAGVAAALIRLVGRFEEFVREIRDASRSINERSDRLDIQARELESASQTTQHQIQEVTDSMKAMADQASTIEASTRESTETVQAAVAANSDIQSGLLKSETAAEHTVEVIGRVSGSIQELAESASKIEKVIGVIAEIAEQTNLLALNAAIEAARAGEHGRGFAVVADEVRTLSKRTADSTGEINQWVADLVRGVQGVEHLIDEMTGAGDDNRQTLEELKGHLVSMNHRFSELERQSITIDEALSLQRDEIDRVGDRFITLDAHAATVSNNVAGSREISLALKQEADSMSDLTGRFQTSTG
ncbi:methyl-accepting chemotaxis protein [Marinobacter sp. HL-58]|uniref:methyl-accepting chemotaxis protein n=1 Tax=Marinobacter sp. HL-58 TaxID=1479237 RepID=UPI00047F5426|nr:methyl-accepting chemotaxis protein [Marinobacter sp. HL-58]KPQ01639.1 MAG: methyl-accepting chemotaxis protein [Marinobacter sp. HL-58]